MSTITLPTALSARTAVRTLWETNRPLALSAFFSVALLAFTLLGLLVDPRTLVGEPLWLKPTKFAISSIFYSVTVLWLISHIEGHGRAIRAVSWVTAVALFVELVLIAFQAVRGVRSHFNTVTLLDGAIFSTMGTMIMLLWLASLVALLLLIRQPFANPAWGLSLKLALAIGVLGAGLGWLMTMPTGAQLAHAQNTGEMPQAGAHTVGLADGEGGKLPVVGWNTEAGDLRVGHFIGMHAMQVLPLLGAFIVAQNAALSQRKQKQLVWIAGAGYLGVVVLVTWQALQGEALVAPSVMTLLAWGVLLTAVFWTAAAVVRPRQS